jgi:hypothetical protein
MELKWPKKSDKRVKEMLKQSKGVGFYYYGIKIQKYSCLWVTVNNDASRDLYQNLKHWKLKV